MNRKQLRYRGLATGALVGALIGACVSTVALPAAAETPKEAFNLGMKYMAEKKYDKACDAFRRSEEDKPTMASRYQLGRCNESAGRTASAHYAYLDAARLADEHGEPARAKVARRRATELEAKSPLLLVQVPPEKRVEGLSFEYDGKPLPEDRWNKSFPVDPGKHSLTVKVPGLKPFTMVANANEPQEVALFKLPDLNSGSPAPSPQPGTEPEPGDGSSGSGGPVAPADTGEKRGLGGLFWTGVGVGGAGLIIVAVSAATWEERDCFDDFFCEGGTPIANVFGLVLGGSMLAAATPMIIVGAVRAGDSDEPNTGITIQPIIGPAYGGVLGTF